LGSFFKFKVNIFHIFTSICDLSASRIYWKNPFKSIVWDISFYQIMIKSYAFTMFFYSHSFYITKLHRLLLFLLYNNINLFSVLNT